MIKYIEYTPLNIANYLISKYGEKDELNPIKLNKLVYLIYCWWLSFNPKPLLAEKPQLWKYGPIFESLYLALKPYKLNLIKKPVSAPFVRSFITEDNEIIEYIEWVYNRYKYMTSGELSTICHKPNTPWAIEAKKNNYRVKIGHTIPDYLIYEYYSKELKNLN